MNQNEDHIDILEMLEAFRREKSVIDWIPPSLLPNIDLYMDQVTTFMEENLKGSKRYPEDKILTKTMINNYAKNNLLPPPEKKKYNKDHLLLLIFIYYYKNFLSINDIRVLLEPITKKYYKTDGPVKLEDIYTLIFNEIHQETDDVINDMEDKYHMSRNFFADAPAEDRDLLSLFCFICTLSFDIYFKKQLIERIIDKMEAISKTGKEQEQTEKKQKKTEKK